MKLYLWVLPFLLSTIGLAAPHFFKSDISEAFKEAKKTKRPLMIDFFGVWCPPCNQLNETVFETPKFIEKSKHFVLLGVDADKPESFELKSRYKIGGYPTVLFVNASGEELYRFVGYRTPLEVDRIMELVRSTKNISAKKACESNKVDETWRCFVLCSEQKTKTCVESSIKKLEGKLPKNDPRDLLIRSYLAENAETTDLKVATYAQLLKENPGSAAAFSWALGYWGAVKEQKVTTADTKLIESAVTHFEKALTDPMRDALGFSKTDLYLLRAEAVALLGNHEKTKLMWKEAAEFLDTSAKALPQGMTDRGFRLEEIWALDSAGEVDKALALSQKYREKFPNEFTFHYVAGSILERRKKPAEALPLAQRAVDTGYGDNRIRAATLLVKCLAATGGVSEAKKVQAQIHKEFPIDTKLEVRTHRYLKQLDDTMQKVQNL